MAELLIIADDITGAVEAGVQLSKQQIASVIIINSNVNFESVFSDNSLTAIVVNTESRHLLPAEAAEKVRNIIQLGLKFGIKYFYKKTDSTLRGNIGAELQALLKETKQEILPYVPAHPRLKRFTKKGYQYLGDRLLHETGFSKDPLEPVTESFVPAVLNKQTELDILISDFTEIQESDKFNAKKERIVVFDCLSVDDLFRIGDYLKRMNWHNAIAGTAAMMEIIPKILFLKLSEVKIENPKGPLLLINGSLNDVSIQQVEYARNSGVISYEIPEQLFLDANYMKSDGYLKFGNKVKSALKEREDVVISTSGINTQKLSDNKSIQLVPAQVGKFIVDVIKVVPDFTLGVFGGDTLNGILREIDANSIQPNGELINGVASSSFFCSHGKIHLITKPGGYGENDEIIKILTEIKRKEV